MDNSELLIEEKVNNERSVNLSAKWRIQPILAFS